MSEWDGAAITRLTPIPGRFRTTHPNGYAFLLCGSEVRREASPEDASRTAANASQGVRCLTGPRKDGLHRGGRRREAPGMRIPCYEAHTLRRRGSRYALVACLALAGCRSDTPSASPFTVSDSAGVRLITSSDPAWAPGSEWTFSGEPHLEIGSVDGEEPYLLQGVRGVATLSDGRVAIAMSGDNSIRFYTGEGLYLSRVGGRGDGPGEFSSLTSLHLAGERLFAGQRSGRPINVFDEVSGDFLEGVTPPAGSGSILRGALDDGSLIFQTGSDLEVPASGAFATTATITRLQSGGELDTIGVFPSQTLVATRPGGAVDQQFGPRLRVAVGPREIVTAHSDEYAITRRGPSGEVQAVIRRDWDAQPVTAEDVTRRDNERRDRGTNEQEIDAMVYPEFHPAFERVLLARSGHLWVQQHDRFRTWFEEVMGLPDDTPTPWDVYSPEGEWLGTVEQPSRLRIMEIGEDYAGGIWVDELGVEFVRFYRLTPGTP